MLCEVQVLGWQSKGELPLLLIHLHTKKRPSIQLHVKTTVFLQQCMCDI